MSKTLTGGCQCGRIRYAVKIENDDAYLCHCCICQRATDGFAAAFVGVPADTSIRCDHRPDWYDSSPIAHRAFCSSYGTSLGFAFLDGDGLDLTVGSFDDPSRFVPVLHAGAEAMHEAWLDTARLPRQTSGETESVTSRWRAAGLELPQ